MSSKIANIVNKLQLLKEENENSLVFSENLQKFSDIINKTQLTQEEKDTLLALSVSFQEGSVTPQVPMYDLTGKDGVSDIFSDLNNLKKLFDDGILVWKTNYGLITQYECRSPKTNHKVNGYLFLSPEYVKKNIDVLFELCCENFIQSNEIPYTRHQFDSILAHKGKEYDFANILPAKKRKNP